MWFQFVRYATDLVVFHDPDWVDGSREGVLPNRNVPTVPIVGQQFDRQRDCFGHGRDSDRFRPRPANVCRQHLHRRLDYITTVVRGSHQNGQNDGPTVYHHLVQRIEVLPLHDVVLLLTVR